MYVYTLFMFFMTLLGRGKIWSAVDSVDTIRKSLICKDFRVKDPVDTRLTVH